MAKRFPLEIFISATDKASAVLNRLADRVERFQAPFTRLRKAFGEFADKTGLAKVGTAIKNVGAEALAVGRRVAVGLSVATIALGAFIKRHADAGDAVNDTAERLNIGRGALQEFTYAFKFFGVEQAQVVAGLDSLHKNLGQAQAGMGKAVQIFRGLGIDPKKFKSTSDLLPVLANRLSRISDPAKRAAIAGKLLSDSAGPQMAVLLGKGTAELARWREEARKTGSVIEDEALDGVSKFNDQLDKLGFMLRGSVGNALGKLYPALTNIGKAIEGAIVRYQPQIEAFAEQFGANLPRYIEAIVDAFRGLRDALSPVVNLVAWMVDKFGAGNTVMISFAAIVGGKLIGALLSLGMALVGLGVKMTVAFGAPLLIVAGVAAAVAAGWWLYKNWDKVSAGIGKIWDRVVDGFKSAWERIKKAARDAFGFVLDTLKSMWDNSPFGLIFRGFGAIMDRIQGTSGAAPVSAPSVSGRLPGPWAPPRQQVDVKVDLSNLPPGTRATATASDGIGLDLSRGFAMPGLL